MDYIKNLFLKKYGYFDEELERNQDINMHNRIKKAGYKFYFNPEIKVDYYVRNSVKKMMRQGYLNGKWNIVVFKQDRKSLSLRHLVPLIFVLSIIALSICAVFNRIFLWLLGIEMTLYFLLGIWFAIQKTKKLLEIIKMMLYFLFLHLSYGVGSLLSIF